jgi:hypothetical protein
MAYDIDLTSVPTPMVELYTFLNSTAYPMGNYGPNIASHNGVTVVIGLFEYLYYTSDAR